MSSFKMPNFKVPDFSSKFQSAQSSVKIPDFSTEIPKYDTSIPEFDTSIPEYDIQGAVSLAESKLPNIDSSGEGLGFLKDMDIQSMIPKDSDLSSKIEMPNMNNLLSGNLSSNLLSSSFGSGLGEKVKGLFPNLKDAFEKSGLKNIFKELEIPSMDDLKKEINVEDLKADIKDIDLSDLKTQDFSDLDISSIFKDLKK